MRFLLDQSSDARLILYLNAQGHDVTRIAKDYPGGLPDREVLALAFREQRVLITDDRDFGELVFRLAQPHTGVIFFRLNSTRLAIKVERLSDVLTRYADQLQEFLVVTQGQVRVRQTRQPEG